MADAWGSPLGDTITREGINPNPLSGFGGVPSGINNITGSTGPQRLTRPPTTRIPTPPQVQRRSPSTTQTIFGIAGIGVSTGLNMLGQQKIQQAGGQISGIGGIAGGVQASYQNIAGNLQGQVNAIRTEYNTAVQTAQNNYQSAIRLGEQAGVNLRNDYKAIQDGIRAGQYQNMMQVNAAAEAARQAANQQVAQAQAQAAQAAAQAAQAQAEAQAKTSAASAAASQQARQVAEQARAEAQQRAQRAQQLMKEGGALQQSSGFAGNAVSNIGGFIDNPNLATGARVVGPAVAAGIPLALQQPVPNPISSVVPSGFGLGGGNLLGSLSAGIQAAGAFAEYGNQPGLATSAFIGIAKPLVPGWAQVEGIYNSFDKINNANNSVLYNDALTSRYRTGETLSAVGNTLSQLGSLAGSAFLPVGGGFVGSLIGTPFQAIGAAESQSALYESNVAGVNPNSIESRLYQPIIGGYSEKIANTAAIQSIPVFGTIASIFGQREYEAPSVNITSSPYGDTYYGLSESGRTLNTSFLSEKGANVLALAQANGLNVMIDGDNIQIDLTGSNPQQVRDFYTDLNNAWERTMDRAKLPVTDIFDPLQKIPTLEGAQQIEITADPSKPYVLNERGQIVLNPNFDLDGDGVSDGEEGYTTDINKDGIADYQQKNVRGNVPDDAKEKTDEDSVVKDNRFDGSLPQAEPETPGAQAGQQPPPAMPAAPPPPKLLTPTAYRGNRIGVRPDWVGRR